MNYWLLPLAYVVGGMWLKWLLDLFFLRAHYDALDRQLTAREAECATLKHGQSQTLTDLRNRLTELDATTKAKALAESNLAKGQSDLAALRAHLVRTEEDLRALRLREAELTEREAARAQELQVKDRGLETLARESTEFRATMESRGLRAAELEATAATLTSSVATLRQESTLARSEASGASARVESLEGAVAAQESVVSTLEKAIRGRDAQLADFPARIAALESERRSVATSLGLADRELVTTREELAKVKAQLESVAQAGTNLRTERASLRTQLESTKTAREEAAKEVENLRREQEAGAARWEQESRERNKRAEATEAENRQLRSELATLRQQLQTTELAWKDQGAKLSELTASLAHRAVVGSELAATSAPAPGANTDLVQKLRDLEAELEVVSQSHAQLETELATARQKLASPPATIVREPKPEPAAKANQEANLLAEIDELNRERNLLAAELAVLKVGAGAEARPGPGATRKRRPKPPETDLFAAPGEDESIRPVEDTPGRAGRPVDGSAATEAVPEFARRCPQNLSDVKGIGPAFEQRLYAAGVGSYWELSLLSDRTIREVLELDETPGTPLDLAAIRADAARLAGVTKSLGRKWTGETPDDLEPLIGIGPTIEQRLYDAGICTFSELAKASEEELAEICPPAKFRGADYASWIQQAQQRLAAEEN